MPSSIADFVNQLSSPPQTPAPLELENNPPNSPVDSIGPEERERNTDLPSTQQSPPVPSCGSLNTTPAKRGRVDTTQYALALGHRKRLKASTQEALNDFARLDMPQQLVWIAGNILELQEQEASYTGAPTDSTFSISSTLADKIEECVFHVLISPQLSAYVSKKVPVNLIIGHLKNNAQWGFTEAVHNNPNHCKVVTKRIGERLTHRRNEIKNLIIGSIGKPIPDTNDPVRYTGSKDILVVCKDLVQLGDKIGNRAVVTIVMLARVAFLRHALIEHGNTIKYWDFIDSELETIRNAKKDPAKISRVFARILSNDRIAHGGDNEADYKLHNGAPSDLSQDIFG